MIGQASSNSENRIQIPTQLRPPLQSNLKSWRIAAVSLPRERPSFPSHFMVFKASLIVGRALESAVAGTGAAEEDKPSPPHARPRARERACIGSGGKKSERAYRASSPGSHPPPLVGHSLPPFARNVFHAPPPSTLARSGGRDSAAGASEEGATGGSFPLGETARILPRPNALPL